ncbi:hypothetical protein FACS189418_3050 [Clostridia bacterium]|nr:hypothetical protein FACS189418_3050 [Clostridia bacterium]
MPKMENKFSYLRKKHSEKGVISFILSLIALLFFCISAAIAYQTQGNSPLVGVVYGFCSFLLSLAGLGFSILGFLELERNTLFAKIGLILNGVLFFYFCIIMLWRSFFA